MQYDRSAITGMCALQVHLARMDGHRIDKKCNRHTAMADYVAHCVAVGAIDPLVSVIFEAVETAIVGNAMHTGEPFDRAAVKWMEIA